MPDASPVVALVDDDHRVLESLQDLLSAAGMSVRSFSSATELLESGALPTIHCVVSDSRMPVIDGWRLVDLVADARPGLPVILITGDDSTEHQARARRALRQPHACFAKPFESRELLAAIASAVNVPTD